MIPLYSDGYGHFGLIDLDLGGGLSPTGLNRRQDRGGQESQDCKTGNELFFRFLHGFPPCILVNDCIVSGSMIAF